MANGMCLLIVFMFVQFTDPLACKARRTSSRLVEGGGGGAAAGGDRGDGDGNGGQSGPGNQGTAPKAKPISKPRKKKSNVNDTTLLASLPPPVEYVPNPFTPAPPLPVPDTQLSMGYLQPPQAAGVLNHHYTQQPSQPPNVPDLYQSQYQTPPSRIAASQQPLQPPNIPDPHQSQSYQAPPDRIDTTNLFTFGDFSSWANPRDALSDENDDDIDNDRGWNTGFQGADEEDNNGENESPYSLPQDIDTAAHPQEMILPPQHTYRDHNNYARLSHDYAGPTSNSQLHNHAPQITAPVPPLPPTVQSSRMAPFRGSRVPQRSASTSEQELQRRLTTPLHSSTSELDTLGVSRSRRSSGKIAGPYELNARSSKSLTRSRPASAANSQSASSSAFIQGLLVSASNSQGMITRYFLLHAN